MIEFNINKRELYVFVSLILVLLCLVFVSAYNVYSGDPSIFGHPLNQVEGGDSYDGTIPSGFCMISYQAGETCPTGFAKRTNFEGRTIRGIDSNTHQGIVSSGIVGVTGGIDTHIHNYDRISGYRGQSGNRNFAYQPILGASNWPPYVNVLICCKT